MNSYERDRVYELLPAVYRLRDAELGYPLRDLVDILAEQARVVDDDIADLYENWFIETCADWLVPYIGDLLGIRGIHIGPGSKLTRRAEVANTISYRRRKGTAAVLEQLARDVTGWPARVVEYFELLSWTQYLNHLRPHSVRTPDLRQAESLELVDGPLHTAAHTAEVRRIASRRGRYNIPSVGLHLWRLQAYPLRDVTPFEVPDGTGRHFTFSVLGNPAPLFHHPLAETGPRQIAQEVNLPVPIRRRAFHARRHDYFPKSVTVERNGVEIPPGAVQVCNLDGWAREPAPGNAAIDPALGRLAFADDFAPTTGVRVTYHYGFADDVGGGSYPRRDSFRVIEDEQLFDVGAAQSLASIQDALDAWDSAGKPDAVVFIHDNATYEETPAVDIPAGTRLEIRAADGERPALLLTDEMVIHGGDGSAFEINGLLIANHGVRAEGELNRLVLQHTTLVPGGSLDESGDPTTPGAPSLVLEAETLEVRIERSILGPALAAPQAEVALLDSIVDAHDRESAAFAAESGSPSSPGASLTVSRSTIIGTVDTRELTLAENSIFLGVVTAERRQRGCVRFSHVPLGSRVPRRYRCQPHLPPGTPPGEAARIATRVFPKFTSLRYGSPAYCQLHWQGPPEIWRGADDGSEMGVFSSLQQPQREDALRTRLEEYLPVRLEAGILYAT